MNTSEDTFIFETDEAAKGFASSVPQQTKMNGTDTNSPVQLTVETTEGNKVLISTRGTGVTNLQEFADTPGIKEVVRKVTGDIYFIAVTDTLDLDTESIIDKDEITAEVRFFNIGETELCEYDFESSEEYFAAMERGEEEEIKEMDKYLAEQGGLPTVMWG